MVKMAHFVTITHRSTHHALQSGTDWIAQYLPGARINANPTNILPYRLRKWLSNRRQPPYSTTSVSKEVLLLASMLRRRGGIAFFTHAENDFYYTGFASSLRQWQTLGWFHYPPKQLDRMIPNPAFLRRMNLCLCVGTNQIEYLRDITGHRRVSFLPLGIDSEFFAPLPDRVLKSKCLFVGQHLRDFELLGRVLRQLKIRIPELETTAILRADSQSKLPQLDWLNCLSGISDERLRQEYWSSAILLLPLVDATACTAILEATACGLPVVTNDIGGVRDYLDEGCAVLCPPGDADSMVEAAFTLLTNRLLNQQMQLAARQKAIQFSWPTVVTRFESILKVNCDIELRNH